MGSEAVDQGWQLNPQRPGSRTHSLTLDRFQKVLGGAWGGNAHMILVGYFSTVEGFRTGLILRWGVGGEKKINE